MRKKILYIKVFILSFVLSISCNKSEDSTENENEVKEITLEGKYIGTWNSDTDENINYTDYGISAKLSFPNGDKTKLRGEFFASTSFSSCCNSGTNDGTINMVLDGDTITSFSYNDIIPECEGVFSGKGSITSKDPFTLEVNFTGKDCDGNHVGVMKFKRTRD